MIAAEKGTGRRSGARRSSTSCRAAPGSTEPTCRPAPDPLRLGADLLPRAHRGDKRLGAAMEQSYGLTESPAARPSSARGPRARLAGEPDLLRSCGRPIRAASCGSSTRPHWRRCRSGQPGEVLIRSAQVMAGYWQPAQESAHTLRPTAGCVPATRLSRRRRVPVPGRPGQGHDRLGRREHLPGRAGAGADQPTRRRRSRGGRCAVRPLGRVPVAVVVREPAANLDSDALIAWCRERLAHYKCPVAVHFVDALPRNASGKCSGGAAGTPVGRARARVG